MTTQQATASSDHDLLIAIHTELTTLKEKLTGYVPEKIIEHSGDIAALRDRISSLEQQRLKSLEDSVGQLWKRLWWLVGIALTPGVATLIYQAFKH